MLSGTHEKYHQRTPDYVLDLAIHTARQIGFDEEKAFKFVNHQYQAKVLDGYGALCAEAYVGKRFIKQFNSMCDWQL